MNSHEEIRRNLPAYCSGDLSPSEQAQVRDHLASCPACRGELTELETVLRLLRTTPQVEPPPWLATRVMARVREQHSRRSSWLGRLFFPLQVKLPLEIAALLVVCLTGWYLTRTVETELKHPSRADIFEQAPPAAKPEAVKPSEELPAPAVRGNVPPPAVPQQVPLPPLKQPEPQNQPAVPHPPPSPAAPPALQTTPSPSSPSRLPKAETPLPTVPLQPAPAAESADRLRDAPSDRARKSLKEVQRNEGDSFAPAPAGRAAGKQAVPPSPALTIHLETTDPTAAPTAIREAAERSGGYVSNGRALTDRRLTVTVPARRFTEFRLRLSWIGRIPPIPPVDPGSGTVEVTVSW